MFLKPSLVGSWVGALLFLPLLRILLGEVLLGDVLLGDVLLGDGDVLLGDVLLGVVLGRARLEAYAPSPAVGPDVRSLANLL